MDVASIEANIEFHTDCEGQSYPTNVQEITGIALSSKDIDTPGFPGATLMGVCAAFAQGTKDNQMNINDLKAAIAEGNYTPSQFFDIDAIMKDTVVDKALRANKKNLHEQNLRLQKEVDTANDALTKKDNDTAAEITKLKSEVLKKDAGSLLTEIAGKRKIEGKKLDFIKKNLPTFSTESTEKEKMLSELDSFVDSQLVSYKETALLFGVKDETLSSKQKPPDTPPDGGTPAVSPLDDNPFIPGSRADKEWTD